MVRWHVFLLFLKCVRCCVAAVQRPRYRDVLEDLPSLAHDSATPEEQRLWNEIAAMSDVHPDSAVCQLEVRCAEAQTASSGPG